MKRGNSTVYPPLWMSPSAGGFKVLHNTDEKYPKEDFE